MQPAAARAPASLVPGDTHPPTRLRPPFTSGKGAMRRRGERCDGSALGIPDKAALAAFRQARRGGSPGREAVPAVAAAHHVDAKGAAGVDVLPLRQQHDRHRPARIGRHTIAAGSLSGQEADSETDMDNPAQRAWPKSWDTAGSRDGMSKCSLGP